MVTKQKPDVHTVNYGVTSQIPVFIQEDFQHHLLELQKIFFNAIIYGSRKSMKF